MNVISVVSKTNRIMQIKDSEVRSNKQITATKVKILRVALLLALWVPGQ